MQSSTFSRRRLLQMGGLSALGMTTPGMVAARVGSGAPVKGAAEKSCIFILLCGGPSHLDTWDLKPNAPDEIRGPYKPIATAVPGMRISELNQRMAKMTDKFALIRSMTHPGNISNHFDAMHNSLSGQASAPADSPYIGSILAKVRPTQKNIASYVWLIKCVGDPVFCAPNLATGGNLGAPYAPLFVGSAENHPAMPGFKAPDVFQANETPARMEGRRSLLTSLEHPHSESERGWRDIHGALTWRRPRTRVKRSTSIAKTPPARSLRPQSWGRTFLLAADSWKPASAS